MGDPSDLNELEQLAQAARQTPGAIDALIRMAHGHVYRWALVRTADETDAEDVAQEVAFKLARSFRSFDGRGRFAGWLYQMTAHAVTDHYRRNRRHAQGRVSMTEAESVHRDVPNLESVDDDYAAALIREFFDKLPSMQREVFHLVDVQGFRPVEVAQLLGKNVNTIRAHLFKARRSIRRKMLERHPELVKSRQGDA